MLRVVLRMSLADGLRLLPVSLAFLLIAGCEEPSAPENSQAAPPPAVTVVAVAGEAMAPTSTFTGRVEAVDTVDLRARVEGFLEIPNKMVPGRSNRSRIWRQACYRGNAAHR
ncbi:MAG: hypothetical protein L0210_00725 [Rhodospirillales bacterium]|nr:hypothetical protein [Rhodospirillales bacterium]